MGRLVMGKWCSPTAEGVPALAVTAVFFALGSIVGGVSALQMGESGRSAVEAYLDRFLALAGRGGLMAPTFGELLWRSFRWHAAAFLLGFTALGLIGLPILCLLRGFFLTFSVGSLACALGRKGAELAALLLGIPCLFTIPAFFLLSVQSLSAAYSLAGRTGGKGPLPYRREYITRCILCAAAVCIGLLLERYVVPRLVAEFVAILGETKI